LSEKQGLAGMEGTIRGMEGRLLAAQPAHGAVAQQVRLVMCGNATSEPAANRQPVGWGGGQQEHQGQAGWVCGGVKNVSVLCRRKPAGRCRVGGGQVGVAGRGGGWWGWNDLSNQPSRPSLKPWKWAVGGGVVGAVSALGRGGVGWPRGATGVVGSGVWCKNAGRVCGVKVVWWGGGECRF